MSRLQKKCLNLVFPFDKVLWPSRFVSPCRVASLCQSEMNAFLEFGTSPRLASPLIVAFPLLRVLVRPSMSFYRTNVLLSSYGPVIDDSFHRPVASCLKSACFTRSASPMFLLSSLLFSFFSCRISLTPLQEPPRQSSIPIALVRLHWNSSTAGCGLDANNNIFACFWTRFFLWNCKEGVLDMFGFFMLKVITEDGCNGTDRKDERQERSRSLSAR